MANSRVEVIELPNEGTSASTPGDQSISAEPADDDYIIRASLLADTDVPDGGYGWVVVGACRMMLFWAVGTAYSWGIIQAALVKQSVGSPSTLAFVGSLSTTWVALMAIVNARLIRKFGARAISITGVSLMALGQVLSGFTSRNVGGLFFTTGTLVGVGLRYGPRAVSYKLAVADSGPQLLFHGSMLLQTVCETSCEGRN